MAKRDPIKVGDRFGKLVVEAIVPGVKSLGVKRRYICVCDCGGRCQPIAASLLRKRLSTKTCGCSRKDAVRRNLKKHGASESRTYASWMAMRTRCNKPYAVGYHDYGGRGIRVCERWNSSFENFLADMGERPAGMTLDRIDVNGDYRPENCRWATPLEQASNRRNNRMVEVHGRLVTVSEAARIIGIHHVSMLSRIRKGRRPDAPKNYRFAAAETP